MTDDADACLNFKHEGGGSPFGEVLYYIFFPSLCQRGSDPRDDGKGEG